MNNKLPKRKNIRLTNYDYSKAGCYFVTICTENKRCILCDVNAAICRPQDGPIIQLAEYGNIIEQALFDIQNHYLGVHLDKYVIMPNHIHAIIVIESSKEQDQIAAPTASLSGIIGQLKRVSSMKAEKRLWQKGYYDHIIRNEADYRRVWQYIDNNPGKWIEDEYYCQ